MIGRAPREEERFVRLKDRVAIITGGARGIGRAIALGLAREGARVAIADVRMPQARDAAEAIEASGGQALALEVDVSRLADLDRMIAGTVERFAGIDILCNNAGVPGGIGDLFAYTEADWDRVLAINLKSAFFATQKAARVMIDQGRGGVILNTASTSGFIASTRPVIPYDVSKGGIRQMTVSLAAHLADHGIRVNAIAPGTIDTEFAAGMMDPAARRALLEKRARERIPLKRLGQPEDLVGAAVFLCSDEAAYVTGHVLVVDGGILVR
jgi:NAD(P)-dependent dehydrogenase (short-subunit alcohol dehydrogenase family)